MRIRSTTTKKKVASSSNSTSNNDKDVYPSIPVLSHQLLAEIFSHLTTSPPITLYRILLVSRTFHDLAKPYLYHHVRISSKQQCKQLKEIRRDDAKLIRRVTIKGSDDLPRTILEQQTDNWKECRLGPGVVEEIFNGKLLDITTIRTVHVSNVHEAPRTKLDDFQYSFKPAISLVELSVVNHQGGGGFWDSFLTNESSVCPKLKRVGFHDVTTFRYYSSGKKTFKRNNNNNSNDNTNGGGGVTVVVDRDKDKFTVEVEPMVHQNPQLHSKLDVIVCNHRLGLGQNGTGVSLKHLLLSPPPTPLSSGWLRLAFKSGFNVRFVRVPGDEIPPNSNFQMLLDGAKQNKGVPANANINGQTMKKKQSTVLHLPYWKHELNKDVKNILNQFKKLNTKIFFKDDDEIGSVSIIPRQFVEFVMRQKVEEEDSSSDEDEEE